MISRDLVGEVLRSFTIVTKVTYADVSQLHELMQVILEPVTGLVWLGEEAGGTRRWARYWRFGRAAVETSLSSVPVYGLFGAAGSLAAGRLVS